MKKSGESQDQPASELISKRIAGPGGWRGETLAATDTHAARSTTAKKAKQ